jgi:hypothetical protein
MICYHGTSEENWKKIQKEGVLWGGYAWHQTNGKDGYRYTYLSPEKEVAEQNGSVLLEVEYNPIGLGKRVNGKIVDNFVFDTPPGMTCWQFSVFVPIRLDKVTRVK